MTIEELLIKYEIDYPPCGASCGEGWFSLIEKLFQDLIAAGWNRELFQLKEKFGSLRIYVNDASDSIYELIDKAENASSSICEVCGRQGGIQMVTKYWMKCVCESCRLFWPPK